MKQIKRFFAIILSLSILVTLLPSIALTANATEQWLWPAEGCYVVSSNFGHRKWWSSADQAWREDYHKGIDIVGDNGTLGQPVRATKSGTIYDSCNTIADNQHISGSRGNFVAIDHGDGTCSMYMHLRPYNVKTSGSVQQGEIIGYIGNTGDSDGAHLHFQLYTNRNDPGGSLINPMPTNSQIRIDNKSSYAIPSDWPQDWITYIFDANIIPTLTMNPGGGSTISSSENITFSWTQGPSFITGYNLYIAKQIPGTTNYDFGENSRIYLPGLTTTSYTVKRGGTLSAGAYAAYVQPWNQYTDEKGEISNFVYFVVHDDILIGINDPADNQTYDLSTDSEIRVRGFAVNTGKKVVTCYASIDDGERIKLDAVSRPDVQSSYLYADYCPSDMVGFIGYIPTKNLSVGTHTIHIFAESSTRSREETVQIKIVSSHIHSYSTTVIAPTCTSQGYTLHLCSCGDSYKDAYTAALGHSYTYKVTTTPTTSTTGVLTGTCSRCSATTTVTLPKLNTTDYTYSVTKAATCTATGTGRYTWKTTTYGTFYFDVTIAKTAHTYIDTVTAPTCTEKGYTTHTCSSCGDSYKDMYKDALGHSWDDGVVTTKPTETSEGIKTFTCSRCGATKTESVPVLDHTHAYTPTVTAPSCTAQGYTTYTCSCGDSYVADYVAALGHSWDDGVVTTKPTETSEGIKTFTCSRCGATRTESVPALGHTHSYSATVTSPTCTEKGYTTYTCVCGESYVTDYVGALGHDFVDGVCTRCGETDPNYNPPTPKDPCEGYTDINRNGWYHSAADFVIERGLMGSTTTDALTFEPNTPCTRSMIVMILYNIAGNPAVTYEAKFPDVPAGKWYTNAIMWAYQNGIVSGYDNGKFGPNDQVTREQMAVLLKGYADFIGKDTSKTADLSKFPDGNKAKWSRPYISWAVAEGLISGKAQNGKTYLDPQGVATRAEVAALIRSFVLNILEAK